MNKLREILKNGQPSVATRVSSRWPIISEIVGISGQYDYVEYLAEYSPFGTEDFENVARACELHGMGSIVKIDFQNRAYVAQKALAAGIQGVLFTDCKTADEVRDCVYVTSPDTPEDGGRFGFPNYRWPGYRPLCPQMEYAQTVRDCVRLFMIEKKDAVDNIEAICDVPGVDMIQFGPSDYSMSCGRNSADYKSEFKAAERHCIEVALKKGVQPRCEIFSAEDAKYYLDLGVRHFCLGDQIKILRTYWTSEGAVLRDLIK
nr:aldolase/citrate lyase family protein [uncultured Dysosmobacter sp.]